MASEGILENHTDFGSESDHFGFILTSGPKGGAVSARFTGGRIEVSVPMETLYHWVNSDEVGIYAEQQAKGEDALTIVIEKDFRCLEGLCRREPYGCHGRACQNLRSREQ